MTQKERLVNKFLEALEVDAECDNPDSIYELCQMLIKEAKLKTLKELKDWYLCEEDFDEDEEEE